jgi:hypothetical protein
MHAYVMKNWIHISVLLTLEQVEVVAIVKNLTAIILQNIMKFNGLAEEQLASCLGLFWVSWALYVPRSSH